MVGESETGEGGGWQAGIPTTIDEGFTLAVVGDCITSRPLAPLIQSDSGFSHVVELMRGASIAVGNLETSILDITSFEGNRRGGQSGRLRPCRAPPKIWQP